MLDLYLAAALAVVITATAWATRTSPITVGLHAWLFPGSAFVASAHGAFIATGVWGLAMPLGLHEQPLRLAVIAAGWAALHLVLEVGAARRPRTRVGCGAHRRT